MNFFKVVNNACATQAIISCLLNLNKEKHEGVELGETLDQFKVPLLLKLTLIHIASQILI